MNGKSPDAFRTISEVADWLGVNTHVLRFWESKFSQVKPVKRAGGRRYYRPGDMELLGGIQKLLHEDGMTIKGVQKVLRDKGIKAVCAMSKPVEPEIDEAPEVQMASDLSPEPETEAPAPEDDAHVTHVDPEPEIAPEPEGLSAPTETTMPLFTHREPPEEIEPDSEAEQIHFATPESLEGSPEPLQAVPDPTPPSSPIIAPLPPRDLPLVDALRLLQPLQIAPEKLAPIHAGLVALRDRMESGV